MDLKDKYNELQNKHSSIRNQLEWLLEEVEERIAPHESIRSEDPQYDDPELWDLYPIKEALDLHLNHCGDLDPLQ